MLGSHRRDLKEAHAETVKVYEKLLAAMADNIDWLRWQLSQQPHTSNRPTPALPSIQEPAGEERRWHMSEEEEDILALRMNEYISDADVRELQATLGVDITTD